MKFLYLIFLWSMSSAENVCQKKAEAPYMDAAMFLNQSCYFTVINATQSSTVLEWALFTHDWVFNLTNAREICAAHGATLPIINGDMENQFVAEYQAQEFVDDYGEQIVFRIALGMQRNDNGDFEWDDGDSVSYEPAQGWERKNRHDCATLRRDQDEPIWMSFPCHGINVGRLGVICKQTTNPDCQYTTRSIKNSCVRYELDKKCYERLDVDILAPPLKGGKECPKYEKRECPCEEKIYEKQSDDPFAKQRMLQDALDQKLHESRKYDVNGIENGVAKIAMHCVLKIVLTLTFFVYKL